MIGLKVLVAAGLTASLAYMPLWERWAAGMPSWQEQLAAGAMSGRSADVRQALAHGAAVNPAGGAMTPLMWAAEAGDVAAIQLLLAAGADVGWRNPFGLTAIVLAAQGGHLQAVSILLDAGVAVDDGAPAGARALYAAAEGGHVEVVRMLLSHGALVDGRGRNGRTPLIGAAGSANGTAEVAELLLQAGADVRAVDEDGNSARSEARANQRWDVLGVLGREI